MEPERRDTHTYIEREKRTGGSGTAMAFIVGGLVVAVALIALVFWGGDYVGDDVDAVGVTTQDQAPDIVVPAAPVENNVEINSGEGAVEAQPSAEPAEPAEPLPTAPAQN